jgi:dihydroneopterin aldolase
VTDRIALRGLRLEAYVGVSDQERARPQMVELDVELLRPLGEAGRADDLARTTDYAAVVEAVAAAIEGRSFRLLEAVAERAAQAAKRHHAGEVVVRARKFEPPLKARVASVEVEIRR